MRLPISLLMIIFTSAPGLSAQPLPHIHDHHDHDTPQTDGLHSTPPLHFSHPLIAESPSPDTKLRIDYQFDNAEDGAQETTLRLEAEYAFSRNLSVELDVPYTWSDPTDSPNERNLGNIDIGLKWASYAFEKHGLLVGGGIELVLPTGDDDVGIGNDHILKIEPFTDVGFKVDDFQIVGFLAFGIPTNDPDAEKDEEDLELEFSVAMLYQVLPRFAVGFEVTGESVVSGDDNETVVNLTPVVKFQPSDDPNLEVGVGVSFPVSNDEDFESRVIASVFKHF